MNQEELQEVYQIVLKEMAKLKEQDLQKYLTEIQHASNEKGFLSKTLPHELMDKISKEIKNMDKQISDDDLKMAIIAIAKSIQIIKYPDNDSNNSDNNSWSAPAGYHNVTIVGTHHGGGGSSGEACFFFALMVIATFVTKEVYTNLSEIFKELANNQRVASNLATLTLTALAVGGCVALLASNPVGWGVIGVAIASVALYCLCAATLIVSRQLTNTIDASISPSDLPGDSRFQLTANEEESMKKLNIDEETIAKIKLSIKALASEVKEHKIDINMAIEQLTKLKQGNLEGATAYASDSFKFKFKQTTKLPVVNKSSSSKDSDFLQVLPPTNPH